MLIRVGKKATIAQLGQEPDLHFGHLMFDEQD